MLTRNLKRRVTGNLIANFLPLTALTIAVGAMILVPSAPAVTPISRDALLRNPPLVLRAADGFAKQDYYYGGVIGPEDSTAIQSPPAYPGPGFRDWETSEEAAQLIPFSFMGEQITVNPATGALAMALPGNIVCNSNAGNAIFSPPRLPNGGPGGVFGWFCNQMMNWWLNPVVDTAGVTDTPGATIGVTITAGDWTPYYFKCFQFGDAQDCVDQQYMTWHLSTLDGVNWILEATDGTQYIFGQPHGAKSQSWEPIVLTQMTHVGWANPAKPQLLINFNPDDTIASTQTYLGQTTTYTYNTKFCTKNADCPNNQVTATNPIPQVCNQPTGTCMKGCNTVDDCPQPIPNTGQAQGYACTLMAQVGNPTAVQTGSTWMSGGNGTIPMVSQCRCATPGTNCGTLLTSMTSPSANSTAGTAGLTTTFTYAPNNTLATISLPPDDANQSQVVSYKTSDNNTSGQYKLPVELDWGKAIYRFDFTFVGTLLNILFPNRRVLHMEYQLNGANTVTYSWPRDNPNAAGVLTYKWDEKRAGVIPTNVAPYQSLLPTWQKYVASSKDILDANTAQYGRDDYHHVTSYIPPQGGKPYVAVYEPNGYYLQSETDPRGLTTSWEWNPDELADAQYYAYRVSKITPPSGMGAATNYKWSLTNDWSYGMQSEQDDGTFGTEWDFITGTQNGQPVRGILTYVGDASGGMLTSKHLKSQDVFNQNMTFQLEHDDVNGQSLWTADKFDHLQSSSYANANGVVEPAQTVTYSYDELGYPLWAKDPDGITNITWDKVYRVKSATRTYADGMTQALSRTSTYPPAASDLGQGAISTQTTFTPPGGLSKQLRPQVSSTTTSALVVNGCDTNGALTETFEYENAYVEQFDDEWGWVGCGVEPPVTSSLDDGGVDAAPPPPPPLPDASVPDGSPGLDSGPSPGQDGGTEDAGVNDAAMADDYQCPSPPVQTCDTDNVDYANGWCNQLGPAAWAAFGTKGVPTYNPIIAAALQHGCQGAMIPAVCCFQYNVNDPENTMCPYPPFFEPLQQDQWDPQLTPPPDAGEIEWVVCLSPEINPCSVCEGM
jgi:hypothetical protein